MGAQQVQYENSQKILPAFSPNFPQDLQLTQQICHRSFVLGNVRCKISALKEPNRLKSSAERKGLKFRFENRSSKSQIASALLSHPQIAMKQCGSSVVSDIASVFQIHDGYHNGKLQRLLRYWCAKVVDLMFGLTPEYCGRRPAEQ